ncbi:MAG TPA: hypothetical protein VEP30_11385 [Chthoniobacterales bacterium]|nr:hypothetical protein [Chthoniobacterales bacterium]
MRPLSILLAIVSTILVSGCADPLEQQSGQEVQSRLQRGITGQGQIVPEQREAGDPAGEHSVPQTHP